VDEFQNIAEFREPEYFQKKLRSHWQHHQNVAYCLYGSKRHLMLDVFTNSAKPFYKFGHFMFLNKIETPYLIDFFKSRFEDTGKTISDDAIHLTLTCHIHKVGIAFVEEEQSAMCLEEIVQFPFRTFHPFEAAEPLQMGASDIGDQAAGRFYIPDELLNTGQ